SRPCTAGGGSFHASEIPRRRSPQRRIAPSTPVPGCRLDQPVLLRDQSRGAGGRIRERPPFPLTDYLAAQAPPDQCLRHAEEPGASFRIENRIPADGRRRAE